MKGEMLGSNRKLVCVVSCDHALPDSLLVSVAAMAVYTGYVFIPQHIMAILTYFQLLQ